MDYKLVKLNTARNALRYIIRAFDIKVLYIPYYICPVIRSAVNKENCKIVYYHINTDFRIIDELPLDAYILYPNYFGLCSYFVDEYASKYKNLIVDNAHSFFSAPKGIASFSSLRKFFPTLRDGSFLYTKKTINDYFHVDEYKYQPQRLELSEFIKNEQRLDNSEIFTISNSTLNAYSKINLEQEKQRRISLFEKLNYYFGRNIVLQDRQVPYAYPYFEPDLSKAKKIAKELSEKNIDIYRFWNNLPINYLERELYTNLLVISLNVDESLLFRSCE